MYDVDGDAEDIGSTKIRVVNTATGDDVWNTAALKDYLADYNMVEGHRYQIKITYDYDSNPDNKNGAAGDQLSITAANGDTETFDVDEGTGNEYTTGVFKYDGTSDDITFGLDKLSNNSVLSVSNVELIDLDAGYTYIDPNEDVTVPGTPWTLRANNSASTGQWGELAYKITGQDPAAIGSTTIKLANTVGEQEKTPQGEPCDSTNRWWWTSASLKNYNSGLTVGMEYTGSIVLNITEATAENCQLFVYVDGQEYGYTLTKGVNTIAIPKFAYTGSNADVTFLLDELPTGAELNVSSITFTPDGDWVRVPDNRPESNLFKITNVPYSYDFRDEDSSYKKTISNTYDWTVFAGEWGTSAGTPNGAILFYDPDFSKTGQPMIKIGPGARWDPASAQIKMPNSMAYQDLKDYTSYYMTYEFTSTEKGTVHITHEGYEPNKPERIDITDEDYNAEDGLYHVKYQKKFTRFTDSDVDENSGHINNVYLSLSANTYGDGGAIVQDGTSLPVGTVLSNFKMEFQRTDEDKYTLVNDCRYEGHQDYTPIVKDNLYGMTVLEGYTNSYYGGWMSYQYEKNAEGENAVAQEIIRLDETNGNYGGGDISANTWECHLRIPNRYFYGNREATTKAELLEQPVGTDTNGDPLVDGKEYLLRFYYNVELPSGATIGNNKGIVMTREGYDNNSHTRYQSKEGLNMANGKINDKNGYNSHGEATANGKSGGIPITYNDSKRTTGEQYNKYVQFDFSDLPTGSEITDISWEFYTPEVTTYTAKVIDVTNPSNPQQIGKDEKVPEGETYTVPNLDGITSYEYNGSPIQPGTDITNVNSDITIYVTRAEDSHTVTILNPDGTDNVVNVVSDGGEYTFPTAEDDYAHVKTFEAVSGATEDQNPGTTITNITNDKVYKIVEQYTVTIQYVDNDGNYQELKTVVEAGNDYTFPETINNYGSVKQYKGIVAAGTDGTYEPNDTVTVNKDLYYEVQKQFKITIDGTQVATVDEGDSYTFPEDTGTYAGVKYFVDEDGNKYYPEDTKTPTSDITVKSVYTVVIKDENGINGATLSTDYVKKGDNYTFPQATGTFEDVKDYIGIDGTTGTYNPGGQVTVDGNKTYMIEKQTGTEHTITISNPDGTVRETIYVEDGDDYTLPNNSTPGYDDVKEYTEGQTVRPLGYTFENVQEDKEVTVVPYEYTVTIYEPDGTTIKSQDTLTAGEEFTFPTSESQGYDGHLAYFGDKDTGDKLYDPGKTVKVNEDIVVKVVNQYTITIYDTDGATIKTQDTDIAGTVYTLPDNNTPGYADVKEFTDGTNTYELGSTVTLNKDIELTVVPYTDYNIYIDNKLVDTVREGGSYTTPNTGEYADVIKYTRVDVTPHVEIEPGKTVDNIQQDVYLEATRTPQYTWSINGTVQDTVPEGTVITLPNRQDATYGYLLGDDAYQVGDTYTVNSNVNFITLTSVTSTMKAGAAMRFENGYDDTGKNGIAFMSEFGVNGGKDADVLNSKAFETGMLITAWDTYSEVLDYELDLSKADLQYVANVKNVGEGTDKWLDGETGTYRCGITKMKDANITRDFIARSYATITYKNGETVTVYSDAPVYANSRNIYYIANTIKTKYPDAYYSYDDWKRDIIDQTIEKGEALLQDTQG